MKTIFIFASLIGLASLSACQQTVNRQVASEGPKTIMVRVASQVQLCWFKQGDPVFASFQMATELNSHAGRPRILIVPKGNPTGLPQLVVQAERSAGVSGVATFGPLLDTINGIRIQNDISKWAGGMKSC